MSDLVLANFESVEGDDSRTITLVRPSRKIVITNDSSSGTLLYKFNASEAWGSLFATESISQQFTTRTVYIQASDNWRVWSYG